MTQKPVLESQIELEQQFAVLAHGPVSVHCLFSSESYKPNVSL